MRQLRETAADRQHAREKYIANHTAATIYNRQARDAVCAAAQAWRDVGDDMRANACECALQLVPENVE